jgi:hypothetical protein
MKFLEVRSLAMKCLNRVGLVDARSNQKGFIAILYPAAISTGDNKTTITMMT